MLCAIVHRKHMVAFNQNGINIRWRQTHSSFFTFPHFGIRFLYCTLTTNTFKPMTNCKPKTHLSTTVFSFPCRRIPDTSGALPHRSSSAVIGMGVTWPTAMPARPAPATVPTAATATVRPARAAEAPTWYVPLKSPE